MATKKKELVTLNVRVPASLKELIERYLACDCHTNASEFTRDALREKLAHDAPELYRQLFEKVDRDDEQANSRSAH
jgi:Arc/MetJ-type ribon-helix-helix transcriptional regulator